MRQRTAAPLKFVEPLPAETPEPLALLWYADLKEVAERKHLVKNLLLADTLFVVFGESNSGKTFWILDLCLTIACGRPWRGRSTRKGLVIYVAGEGSKSVWDRVIAYRTAFPEASGGLPFAIIPEAVDFLDQVSIDRLILTVKTAETEVGEKGVLVIIDTFARAIPGGNENDSLDVGLAVAAADRIRGATGCAVGFVHHAGKDPTKGARGSSALRAATDTEILIDGQSGQRTATCTKQRDLAADAPMPFELVPVVIGRQSDDGSDITSCVVKHIDLEDQPPAALRELRGKAQRLLVNAIRARTEAEPGNTWTLMDLRQVGRELGMSKGTARSVVDALVATSYMRPTIGGYRFTDGRVEG